MVFGNRMQKRKQKRNPTPAKGKRERLHKPYRANLAAMGVLIFLGFAALWCRLVVIQVLRHDYYTERARRLNTKTVRIMPRRGDILDIEGNGVAISRFAPSVYIEPGRIKSQRALIAARLGEILNVPSEPILHRLETYKDSNRCLPVARKVDLERVDELIRSLRYEFGLPQHAISVDYDSKRDYPRGAFAAHLVGGTIMDDFGDNTGAEGLERHYDEFLRGNLERYRVLASGGRDSIEPVTRDVYYSAFGANIVTTIHSAIQEAAEAELARVVAEQRADGASIVVMACRDGMQYSRGAILAMANVPTFDPNSNAFDFTRRNRAVTDVIETGSVMKVFFTAMALELGLVQPDTIIDCQNGYARINGVVRRDDVGHHYGAIPFSKVFQHSSNIGIITVAQQVEPFLMRDWLNRMGFGRRTGVDFPGEAEGLINIRNPRDFVDRDSIAIGYGIGVTTLQMANALSVIGSGGLSVQPHLVKEIRDVHGKVIRRHEPQDTERILSQLTARTLWRLMEIAVEDGTGRESRIEGYRVGGKTGTARKYDPVTGYDSKSYRASFGALVPIDDPQFAIYCYVDEPRKSKYGGSVAAPVVGRVAHVALRALGVYPSPEEDSTVDDFHKLVSPIRTQRLENRITTLVREALDNQMMPDLSGLTMVEVQEALRRLPLEDIEFMGSGLAIEQQPEPNMSLAQIHKATVVFGEPQ